MNILEQEDLIKGLPDQALFQQADNPTGDIPQFLIISEIQRRTDMRKRFEAAEPQPQTTAAQRIVSEGLGAAMAPQNSLPPPAMPAPPSNSVSQMDGSSPLMAQGMAAGGILGFANGGVVRRRGGGDLAEAMAELRRLEGIKRQASQATISKSPEQLRLESLSGVGGGSFYSPTLPNPDYYPELEDEWNEAIEKQKALIENIKAKMRAEQVDVRRAELIGEAEEADYSQVEGAPIPSEFLPRSFGDVDIGNIAEMDINEYTGEADYGGQGDANSVSTNLGEGDATSVLTNLGENEQSILNLAEGRLGDKITVPRPDLEKPDLSSDVKTLDTQSLLDSIEAQRTGITDRLDARRSESQELINQIREEGKRDALSAALIQLGAGISSGDMASGLSQAGSAMTSANALARDAARAEQRSMRDYEEAALAQADLLGVEGQRFAYEEAKDAAVRKQALAQWDAEHGLRQDSLALEADFKQAGLDQDYDQFKSGLVMQVSEIAAKAKSDVNLTRREAMRTFTGYMNTIRDIVDDLPASMDADKKIETVKSMQRQMIDALKAELGSEFFNAFAREAQEEAASGSASPTGAEVLSYKDYPPPTN